MPGLDPNVVVHRLAVSKDVPPVKQSQRRIQPELILKVEAEIDKLIRVDFIREVKYPNWLANIVPVLKKNGQICICVDYRDLNRACPKDEFPLPIIELLVDATIGFNALSFVDGFSGYNHIKMAPEDEELTAFLTPKGIYCDTITPFRVKNAGATYQRAMTTVFEDMLHNTIECYVDDLVMTTKERRNHLDDLRQVFDKLRKHQLKMNPLKCAFGLTSGKYLRFIVRHRGIEIDPAKIKVILEMLPPRNLVNYGDCKEDWITSEEFAINFVPQKAIKGQALADFLAAHPIPDNMELHEDLPDEEVFTIETSSWQLFFDGAAKKCGAGAGIVFVTPSGGLIPYSFHILAICTNNEAEYEALIIGLEIALEMQIQSLEVYGDSLLILKQINGEFVVKHEALIPYCEKAKHLIAQFQTITVNHVPRSKNGKANALAKLVASLTLPGERDIQITIGERLLLPQIMERKEEISTIN
ncbi:uncharacterized protein LOC133806112 [Humulus lupulus]|uniref:uncharacterized protein LOC133806112 n=1 Tax=Humulus lupulus TaxID=3486 RepID=UPI002B400F76|nr:uncharacterized protein LOC133806112 [Humulus lupulus]